MEVCSMQNLLSKLDNFSRGMVDMSVEGALIRKLAYSRRSIFFRKKVSLLYFKKQSIFSKAVQFSLEKHIRSAPAKVQSKLQTHD